MNENIKIIAFWAVVLLGVFFILAWASECNHAAQTKRNLLKENNPLEYAKSKCYSKVRGSSPACWSEGDWIAFCKRVQCLSIEEKE